MALTSSNIRQRLISMIDDNIRLDKHNEIILWKKLFMVVIFRASFPRPHYWVVDALDECSNQGYFFQMLAKIEESIPLKILVTSRRTPDIESHFLDLQKQFRGKGVIGEEVTFSDTAQDIKLYIRANMQNAFARNEEQGQELLTKELGKSAGCFLWVKLVVKELGGAWGQQ